MPPYVTHRLPSGPANDARTPVTPGPAVTSWPAGAFSGGHAVRQAPVHVDAFIESPPCVYSVRPSGPVRMVPREPAIAVPTVTAPAADEAAGAAVLVE